MIRILLVEDDAEVARIIKYYLCGDERYEVVWAKNAAEAVIASHDWFDIILMDVMLPDQRGIELCTCIREWHNCPVIFISCLDDSRTIIEALEHGGDDFIIKPFDNQVLEARIQANLRRVRMEHSEPVTNQLACPGFALNASSHTVCRGEKCYSLPPTEFRILSYMMQHPGRCFRSSELYHLIWGRSSYGDNRTVVVHVHNLRKKIEADAARPQYLKSIWGKGYLFDPEGSSDSEE